MQAGQLMFVRNDHNTAVTLHFTSPSIMSVPVSSLKLYLYVSDTIGTPPQLAGVSYWVIWFCRVPATVNVKARNELSPLLKVHALRLRL